MKLLNKTSIYYLLFALPVFAICSGLLYYFVSSEIIDNLDESLVKENKAYRNLEISELQQYELLYELSYPLPAYEGKVAMIFKHITHEHPFFIAGDSPNDHQMLEWAENRLWIARLEKKDYQAATAELIKNSDKEKWLIQPTLYKKSPGFVASEKELETRLKLNTAEKEKFTQTIQVFKNEKALEQF